MAAATSASPQAADANNYNWVAPLIFLINFAVYYLVITPLMDDSDVPWHLATGRLLLETHHVPVKDPWSFASADQPWYLLSWIWDLILGTVEHVGGALGVLFFIVAASAGLMAGVAAQLVRMRIAIPAVFLTIMIGSLCILDFITARPHLSGYIMALVFYMILYRSRGRDSYGNLRWLPFLMLIWANMHGSFMSGFSVLAAYIIEAYLIKNRDWLKRLVTVSLACGICAAINPYGLDVMLGAMRTMNGAAKQYTMEWLPFSFSASTGISTWLILFILSSNVSGGRAAIADKILAIGWLVGTLFVMRNGAIFIVLSAPYFATCLDDATATWREARKPSHFVQFMQRQKLRNIWLATGMIFVLMVTFAEALPHDDKLISKDMSVFDAIDYAMQHYPTNRYLTDFNFGGQVIYRTYGKLPFMVDSRAGTVYSEEVMEDYLEFLWLKPGWEERLKKYNVNALMVSSGTKFAQAYADGQFHDHWQLVFAGTRASVYIARP